MKKRKCLIINFHGKENTFTNLSNSSSKELIISVVGGLVLLTIVLVIFVVILVLIVETVFTVVLFPLLPVIWPVVVFVLNDIE